MSLSSDLYRIDAPQKEVCFEQTSKIGLNIYSKRPR